MNIHEKDKKKQQKTATGSFCKVLLLIIWKAQRREDV